MKKTLLKTLSLLLLTNALMACNPGNQPTPSSNPEVKTQPSIAPPTPQEENTLRLQVQSVNDQAFLDEEFRAQLKADPQTVLTEAGLALPETLKIKVLDVTEGSVFMVLDDRNLERFYPKNNEVKTEDLDASAKLFRTIRLKAQADAEFKAKLLKDTKATLVEQGIHADLAELFKVVDYEADTDFLMILPPDQTSQRIVFESIIRPILIITRNLILQVFSRAGQTASNIADAIKTNPEVQKVIDEAVNQSFNAIEFVCVWPRIFGQSCGVPKTEIKAFIETEILK